MNIAPLPSATLINNAAKSLRDTERGMRTQGVAHQSIRDAIGPGKWQGQTADAIKDIEGKLVTHCQNAAAAVGSAAAALEDLSAYITSISARYQQLVTAARTVDAEHAKKGPVLALLERNQPAEELSKLQGNVHSRISHAAHLVGAAAHKSNDFKTDTKYNWKARLVSDVEQAGSTYIDFEKGVVEGVWDPIKGVYELVRHPTQVVHLAEALNEHPAETLHAIWDSVADTKTWKTHPAEALGKLVPGAVLTILTVGGGVAAKGAEGANAATKAARATETLNKAGKVTAETEKAAESTNYAKNFFDAHPDLKGKVVIHHAIEQQVLKRYPGLVNPGDMHALPNLRGIPKEINNELHLSSIRKEWNDFYEEHPSPTREDLDTYAKYIDDKYGSQFNPPT